MKIKNLIACCPACRGEAAYLGFIPSTNTFAGRQLESCLDGGSLFRCKNCTLGFKWPQLSKVELDELYVCGDENAWSSPTSVRNDWNEAYRLLNSFLPTGSSVLDVGCFDGRFLMPLVDIYKCYGIEIHPKARQKAESNGIRITEKNFSDLTGSYDCITAFDVIEHMENPKLFLDQCFSCLSPEGMLIISTGNLDSFSFRFLGSRYWYCTIAEHISFICPSWVKKQSLQAGFEVKKIIHFSHNTATIYKRLKEISANVIFKLFPTFFKLLRRHGIGGIDIVRYTELAEHPPVWLSAKDHFIVLLKKKGV